MPSRIKIKGGSFLAAAISRRSGRSLYSNMGESVGKNGQRPVDLSFFNIERGDEADDRAVAARRDKDQFFLETIIDDLLDRLAGAKIDAEHEAAAAHSLDEFGVLSLEFGEVFLEIGPETRGVLQEFFFFYDLKSRAGGGAGDRSTAES